MELNTKAKDVIKRLQAINYDEPYWNQDKVVTALERHYELLGVPMPSIEVADNAVIGFELAWGAALDAAWGAARGAAWDAARDAAWGAARDAARGAAWDAARDAARGAARDAARGAALDAALDAARDAAWVAGALNAKPDDPAVIKFVEIEIELLKALENGLGWYFPMKDKLVLVPMPRMILSGDRLHYDHGKAVEWSDGTGFYFLNGVQFDEKLYYRITNEEINLENLGEITNADQRAVAVQFLKPELLLKQVKAKLINIGQKGTELYEVKNFMDTGDTEYCMKMQHPSIKDKFYIEWVEPKIGKKRDADLAQAVAFGFSKQQYLEAEEA